jgi:hypothetical protein
MFRSKNLKHFTIEGPDSFDSENGLLGLDAVIPGGRYDDSVSIDALGENGKQDVSVPLNEN